jgi:transposase
VHRLYFEEGYSKTAIAQHLGVSKGLVVRWTQAADQDLAQDARGWPKGRGRRWDERVVARVAQLHAALTDDSQEFFTGATAIQQRYRRRYPRSPVPPLRTIGRMLRELGLSAPRKLPRAKGAARYLCYPEHTVYHTLGERVLEVDFVGKKFLTGRTAPVNFVGFSFKHPPKLRYYQRVPGETSEVLMRACTAFFRRFEKPAVLKVDNCLAAIGSGSAKRTLSRFVHFLLTRQVLPVFSVPRRPFSQASIEGNNSVFARKFWNTQTFRSLRSLDCRLEWFNASSQRYSGYEAPPPRRAPSHFIPKVYFIRQVREHPDRPGTGYIDVVNEPIALPESFVNYFVLAEWNLQTERLTIWFEKDSTPKRIKSVRFTINPNSQYRLK